VLDDESRYGQVKALERDAEARAHRAAAPSAPIGNGRGRFRSVPALDRDSTPAAVWLTDLTGLSKRSSKLGRWLRICSYRRRSELDCSHCAGTGARWSRAIAAKRHSPAAHPSWCDTGSRRVSPCAISGCAAPSEASMARSRHWKVEARDLFGEPRACLSTVKAPPRAPDAPRRQTGACASDETRSRSSRYRSVQSGLGDGCRILGDLVVCQAFTLSSGIHIGWRRGLEGRFLTLPGGGHRSPPSFLVIRSRIGCGGPWG